MRSKAMVAPWRHPGTGEISEAGFFYFSLGGPREIRHGGGYMHIRTAVVGGRCRKRWEAARMNDRMRLAVVIRFFPSRFCFTFRYLGLAMRTRRGNDVPADGVSREP
eukprot:GHVU01092908.1.p2 GENE.GHVU01092908.1~~GHVU01092908.1.p2  ORF type:complete len:107 (+),score=3.55 GHVU01092908.1:738-1058(+)